MRGVRSKFAAAAKVVSFAGNEVIGKSVACVEMRGERLIVGIYRDKHALTLKIALENALLVGKNRYLDVAVAERLSFAVSLCERGDVRGKLVALGLIERGTKSGVAVFFLSLCAPLAAVVNAGNSGHSEEQRVDERQVARVGEDARDARNIVVIGEAEEVHSAVLAPVFRAETVFQRVTDLEHIHRIEAGVQTLVALIIGSRMQHFRIYPA